MCVSGHSVEGQAASRTVHVDGHSAGARGTDIEDGSLLVVMDGESVVHVITLQTPGLVVVS